jgi:ferredoxin
MTYFRVNERCNGCLACVENCPADALQAGDHEVQRTLFHNMARCARCGNCWRVCPQDAIEFHHLLYGDWDTVAVLDLVRCEVCGDPLYTASSHRTVSRKLGREMKPRCLRHMESIDDVGRAAYIPDGEQTVEGVS